MTYRLCVPFILSVHRIILDIRLGSEIMSTLCVIVLVP
jgi:hypothetical protein